MRVCLISGTYPDVQCGVGFHTYYLAQSLASLGLQVHVLTAAKGVRTDLLGEKNPRVHRLESFGPGIWPRLWALLQDIRPDVCHVQLPVRYNRLGATALFLYMARVARTPRLVLTLHELSESRLAARLVASALVLASPHTIFSNPNDLAWAEQRFPRLANRFSHVPIGPTQPIHLASSDTPQIDPNALAYLGILHPRKGFETLLQAVALVAEQLPAIRLHVLSRYDGRNAYHRSLVQMAERLGLTRNVVFYEFITSEQIVRQLVRSAAVCLPYPAGATFKRSTLLEALAAGTAVVTTVSNRTPKDLRHGDNVYLVPTEDPKALAAGIYRVLSDRVLAGRLRAGGQDLSRRFSWEYIAAETENVYRVVLQR